MTAHAISIIKDLLVLILIFGAAALYLYFTIPPK